MSAGSFTLEGSELAARGMGLVVVKPKPDQLFLDVDDDHAANTTRHMLERYGEHLGVKDATWARSKSGHGWHVTVLLDRCVDDADRIALQAILGSDRHREALSWIAMRHGHKAPTLFFELPERSAP